MLLADDYPDLRELMRFQLERAGFVVIGEATDGQEAVDMAKALSPDVIVLDLAMPKMDGLQALPTLRETSPGSKVIVVSGFANGLMADRVLAAGAARFVEKGVGMDLVGLVEAVVAEQVRLTTKYALNRYGRRPAAGVASIACSSRSSKVDAPGRTNSSSCRPSGSVTSRPVRRAGSVAPMASPTTTCSSALSASSPARPRWRTPSVRSRARSPSAWATHGRPGGVPRQRRRDAAPRRRLRRRRIRPDDPRQGRRPARLKSMLANADSLHEMRPDILGATLAIEEDGTFTEPLRSPAKRPARSGEQMEPPEEMRRDTGVRHEGRAVLRPAPPLVRVGLALSHRF